MSSSAVFKILKGLSERHADVIQNMDKQILKSSRASAEAKEAARLSLCRAGEKISLNGPGGEGWSVEIPDPLDEKCTNCGSWDRWEYRDLESYSPVQTIFYFRCTHTNDEGECMNKCEIREWHEGPGAA